MQTDGTVADVTLDVIVAVIRLDVTVAGLVLDVTEAGVGLEGTFAACCPLASNALFLQWYVDHQFFI